MLILDTLCSGPKGQPFLTGAPRNVAGYPPLTREEQACSDGGACLSTATAVRVHIQPLLTCLPGSLMALNLNGVGTALLERQAGHSHLSCPFLRPQDWPSIPQSRPFQQEGMQQLCPHVSQTLFFPHSPSRRVGGT